MSSDYVHLHNHSTFSILDGLADVHAYVRRAKALGQGAMALTDHGVLCGLPSFYNACRREEIEPVLGCEMYFVPDSSIRLTKTKENEFEKFHVGILAIGEAGYQVLSQLSTESFKRHYFKPLVDRELLESLGDDARHLVVFSGCAASVLSRAVMSGDREKVREEMYWWKETFPNFYIELMHHDTDFDYELNTKLIALAKKYRIPWVVTNDPHYVMAEDECYHDTLLAIQTASDIDDPNRFRFDGTGYHLKSYAEMRKAFKKYGTEVWMRGAQTSVEIAKMCKTRIPAWEVRTWQLPKFPDVEDAFAELKRLAAIGLKERQLHRNLEYLERTKHELKVIKRVGIADFLLITRDSIEWAKQQGIPVGPGRGSVCGTLVGYLIGIHKIDPIRYNLRFERFLNPERPRMPDIDTDFGKIRRSELFTYVSDKYGEDNVVHVAAYGQMKLKSAFQSLAKAHGIDYPTRIRISKQMEGGSEDNEILPPEITEKYPDMVDYMLRLHGVKKSVSAHPAGVIIAEPSLNIKQLVPEMYIPSTKRWVGQYELEAIEHMGLMKQDFLGLRTLDTIDECVKLIERRTGERIDPDSWVPDEEEGDDEVYKMLAEGKCSGVFQMEGDTNERGCREVEPTCFEDVVNITSLYRTGPILAGFPKAFIKNRQIGKKRIRYLHESLRPILEPTWGVILYQEQVMDIGQHLAGFTMSQVDDIKEAIKHKNAKLMASLKKGLIEGCVRKGFTQENAELLWKQIEGYQLYSYNRSHAVAYTFLTYQTARLKKLYPLEFFTALLRTVDSKDRRPKYLKDVVDAGYKVFPPCINRSDVLAGPDPSGEGIRFGLSDCLRVGPKMGDRLLEGRPEGGYKSLEEVVAAARNKGAIDALTAAGAFECFGVSCDKEQQETLLGWPFYDPMVKWRKKYRGEVFLPDDHGGECVIVGEIMKMDKGKTKNNKPYMTWKIRWSPAHTYDIRLWAETERLWKLKKGSVVMVSGEWEVRWHNLSIGNPRQVRVLKRVE